MSFPPQLSRQLALEGCYNLRDIGGYPTLDGCRTRWRTILRSDSLHRLPPSSQQTLLDYGLRTVIDLRWRGETQWEPNVFAEHAAVRYRPMPFYGDKNPYEMEFPRSMGAIYRMDLEQEKVNIKTILESLLEPDAAPALIHCAVGKDRTGLMIALLLGLANVPAETIVSEYALSEACLAPLFADLRRQASVEELEAFGFFLECKPEFMGDTLAYLDDCYGGVAGYARYIGLTDEQLRQLRELLVEPAPA